MGLPSPGLRAWGCMHSQIQPHCFSQTQDSQLPSLASLHPIDVCPKRNRHPRFQSCKEPLSWWVKSITSLPCPSCFSCSARGTGNSFPSPSLPYPCSFPLLLSSPVPAPSLTSICFFLGHIELPVRFLPAQQPNPRMSAGTHSKIQDQNLQRLQGRPQEAMAGLERWLRG